MIVVYYDGACGPNNPGGHGGSGIYITQNERLLYQESYYIGQGPHLSNNVSEYVAVIRALSYLLDQKLNHENITLYGDSNLTVLQLSDKWKCKKGLYKQYFLMAKDLKKHFTDISFVWIPREQNCIADELSKKAIFTHKNKTVDLCGPGLLHRETTSQVQIEMGL